MNDQTIEKLLRKAPAPKAPDGLLEQLQADVGVTRNASTTPASASRTQWSEPAPLWRRWMPALSFAVIFLTCLVAIAVQSNVIADLTRQNETLRASAQQLEGLRAENKDLQAVRNESDELERLKKDAADLAKLREEVARLNAQLQGVDKLRAENQQLQAAISARQAAAGLGDEDMLRAAKDKAQAVQCMNNLRQIGLAYRLWADDNNNVFPKDFISMTNELSTWKLLQCPSDQARKVTSWAQVKAGDVSYKIMSVGPDVSEQNPDVVLVQCPIHGSVCLADGSVQMVKPGSPQRFQTINGAMHLLR